MQCTQGLNEFVLHGIVKRSVRNEEGGAYRKGRMNGEGIEAKKREK